MNETPTRLKIDKSQIGAIVRMKNAGVSSETIAEIIFFPVAQVREISETSIVTDIAKKRGGKQRTFWTRGKRYPVPSHFYYDIPIENELSEKFIKIMNKNCLQVN